jgi:hypothetical protein
VDVPEEVKRLAVELTEESREVEVFGIVVGGLGTVGLSGRGKLVDGVGGCVDFWVPRLSGGGLESWLVLAGREVAVLMNELLLMVVLAVVCWFVLLFR